MGIIMGFNEHTRRKGDNNDAGAIWMIVVREQTHTPQQSNLSKRAHHINCIYDIITSQFLFFFFLILFHFILFYPLLALFVDCHSQVFLYIWGWSASKEAFFLFYFHVRAAMD